MDCREVAEQIIVESGGPCSPEVERHLAGCAACSRLQFEQRALWKHMDAWETPEISPGFDGRLFARIGQRAASPWAPLDSVVRIFRPLQPSFAAALACMLIIATLVVEKDRRAALPVEASAAIHAVERDDLKQIEMALDDVQMLSDFDASASQAEGGKS